MSCLDQSSALVPMMLPCCSHVSETPRRSSGFASASCEMPSQSRRVPSRSKMMPSTACCAGVDIVSRWILRAAENPAKVAWVWARLLRRAV